MTESAEAARRRLLDMNFRDMEVRVSARYGEVDRAMNMNYGTETRRITRKVHKVNGRYVSSVAYDSESRAGRVHLSEEGLNSIKEDYENHGPGRLMSMLSMEVGYGLSATGHGDGGIVQEPLCIVDKPDEVRIVFNDDTVFFVAPGDVTKASISWEPRTLHKVTLNQPRRVRIR